MDIPPPDLARIRDLYVRGCYLQALAVGEPFGPVRHWAGPAARLIGGRLAIQVGAPKLGRRLHAAAFRESPAYPEAAYYFARYKLERFGPLACWEFQRHHTDWSESSPELRADWLVLRAYVAGRMRDVTRADELFAEADAIAPDRPWPHVERASLLEFADRPAEAMAEARKALALQPWFRPAVQAVGHLLTRAGKPGEAIDFLTEASDQIEAGIVVAQLAALQYDQDRFADARRSLDRYAELCPLMEPEVAKWLTARRADVAYMLGERTTAADHARAVGEDFYTQFAGALAANAGGQPDRHRLAVDLTGPDGPADLVDALARFWAVEPLPAGVVVPPADGLPDAGERRRFDAAGWGTREFTFTFDAAHALIGRGLPCFVTLVESGFSQARLVVGTDAVRRSVWVADGHDGHAVEAAVDSLVDRYAPFGPRGLVAVPAAGAAKLDGLDLPDAAAYDRLHYLQGRLHDKQFVQAGDALDQMRADLPGHRLTKFAALAWARATGHPVFHLTAADALLAAFPADATLVMSKAAALRDLGRAAERLALLEAHGVAGAADPLVMQSLAQVLFADHRRQAEAEWLVRRSLRSRPGAAAGYFLLGTSRFDRQRFAEGVDLLRFAACQDDREDQFAESYLKSARAAGTGPDAMKLVQARAAKPATPPASAVRTLFTALIDRDETEFAFAALETAIGKLRAATPADSDADADGTRVELAELLLFRADQYSNLGRFDAADADLDAAHPIAPPAVWYKAAARVARTKPNYTEALGHVRNLLDHDPLNPDAHRIVAGLTAETQGRAAAREYLGVLARKYPQVYPLVKLRAEFLYREPDDAAVLATRDLVELCPADAWAWRQLALVFADKKRHDEALAAIQKAAEFEPTHPSHYAVLAHVHRRADRTGDAVETLREAVRQFPDHEIAIGELVQTARGMDEKKAALRFVADELHARPFTGDGLVAYFEQSIRLVDDPDEQEKLADELRLFLDERPDVWQCWSLVVQTMTGMHRAEEAFALAREATARFPLTAKLWVDRAEAAKAANHPDDALDALHRAVAVAPGWPPLARELAEALTEAGEDDEAVRALERAVTRNPLDAWVRWQLADRLWQADRGDEALDHAKASVRHEPPYDPDMPGRPDLAWGAVMYWSDRLFRPEEAAALAREQTRDRAGDPRAWVRLARTLNDFGEADEILGALDKAIDLDPKNVEAYDLKAERLAQLGRFDEALETARPSALAADLPLILQGRAAWIEARRGNYDMAIPPMQAMVAVDPEYVWGWQQLAEWYNDIGRSDDYLQAADELCRLRPEHPMSLTMRGEAKIQTGDREAGKEDLREVLRTFATYSPAAAILFDACLADDEMTEARTALAVLQEHMTGPEGLVKQVQFAAKSDDPEAAARAFSELCRVPSEGSAMYLQMGLTQMRAAGLEDRSIALMRDAWEAAGEEAAGEDEFNPWAAILWLDSPDGEAAPFADRLAAAEAAVRAAPTFLAGHDRKAELLAGEGRFDEAAAACAPAHLGSPPPVPLRGRLAWLEARRGDRAKAVAMMKAVVADEPDYTWGWRQLVHWYDADERTEESLEAAENLVRLNPGDPVAHVLRGETRRILGDHRGAKDDFEQAFEADPTFDAAGLQLVGEQLATDDLSGAAETIEVLREQTDGPLLKLRAVQLATRRGDLAAARSGFQDLAADPAASRGLLRDAAEAMAEAGWAAEADEDLNDLTESGTPTPAAAGLWAERLLQAGRPWKVADRLDGLIDLDREAGREAVLVYVWAQAVLNDPAAVTATVQRHSELLREDDDAWVRAGTALAEAKNFPLAAAWLGDWRDRPDVPPRMLRPLHTALRAVDRDAEADAVLKAAVESADEDGVPSDYRAWLALTAAVGGRLADAAEHLAAVERLGQPDGTKLLLAMAAAVVAVAKASPAEKATVFADAKLDLHAAAGACSKADVPTGAGRWYRRVVARMAADAGTLSAKVWSAWQRVKPWVRE